MSALWCCGRIIAAAIIVVASLLIQGSTGRAYAQSSEEEVAPYSGGISIMLDPLADQRRFADRQDVFQVAPNLPLRAELGFVQWYPESKQFRIFLLLNYRQVEFAIAHNLNDAVGTAQPLNSSNIAPAAGQLHHVQEITVPPDEEFYFNLWTEPLAAGYYDLALIIVPDPYQNQRELPYFTTSRATMRASVYVGDTSVPPEVSFPLIDATPGEDSGFSELLWFGQEPHKAGLLDGEAVAAGENVTLIANYQPYAESVADELPPGTPLPVAFVAIVDDRVVSLNGQPVLYGSALPGQLSYLPVTIHVPADPGIHQLFIQQFPNPYIDAKAAEESGRELVGESSQRFILDAS